MTADNPLTTGSSTPLTSHPGLNRSFRPDGMSIGAHLPLEGGANAPATMRDHAAVALAAERAGFATLWARDVPLYDRSTGDTAQIFDPFTYLGFLSALTSDIALGTAAIVLPLRHPLHAAKSAASIDQLSGGRFLFGVASGARTSEFSAFGMDEQERGESFREAFEVISTVLADSGAEISSSFGTLRGADVLPKPSHEHIPTFIAGSSRQDLEWMARAADGWLYFTLPEPEQAANIRHWRSLTGPKANGFSGNPDADPTLGVFKPFVQLTNIDLAEDPSSPAMPIHLGFRLGRNVLTDKLHRFQEMGVDQALLGFRHSTRPVPEVLDELGEYVLPVFPAGRS
ncbi:MAG: TIGR03571 family LLM class oxidoreductase [Dermabacter sp.]|nr:TIGR03571 family LLM class oxidoreductase [Dermabacter sp.]